MVDAFRFSFSLHSYVLPILLCAYINILIFRFFNLSFCVTTERLISYLMKDLSIVVLRLALEGGWGCIGQSVVLVILCYGSWVGGDDFFSKFGFFVQQDS